MLPFAEDAAELASVAAFLALIALIGRSLGAG